MPVKVILKDGDELTFDSYAFENNNILHLHGTVESKEEHQNNMNKLDSENASDLYLVAPDISNWTQLTDVTYISEQRVTLPKSASETVQYVDYYLSSYSLPDKSLEVLNVFEGQLDAALLEEIKAEDAENA